MRTTFRFLLIAIVGLGLLAAIGTGVASWYVMRKLGPDFWVQLIEENTNCRADIQEAKLSLLTRPATLTLKDVHLLPRDAEVDKPYDQRVPIAKDKAPIAIPEATLEVKLEDLLSRRLFIQRLHLVKPIIIESQDEEGRSSLEQLFSKHDSSDKEKSADKKATDANTNTAAVSANANTLAPASDAVTASASETSKDSSDFIITCEAAGIEAGRLNIVSRDSTVDIQNIHIDITGIDLSPVAPDTSTPPNKIHIKISGDIHVTGIAQIGDTQKPAEFASIRLSGAGDLSPIDINSDTWNPTSQLTLTLAKGSVLGGGMTIGEAAGKDISKLQEYGIDISDVPIGGALQQDATLEGTFNNNRFTLTKPTVLDFPDYEISIESKSWINASEDNHSMDLRLSCGPTLQKRVESGMAKARLGDDITKALINGLSDDHGRLTFEVKSVGPLSHPKVKFSIDRMLKNILRGDGLKNILQGLFGK